MPVNKLFFCYSFRLAYFIKSQGMNYINKGKNRNNGLTYYVFNKSKELDEIIILWNKLKEAKNGES